jgi:hypothetical protein
MQGYLSSVVANRIKSRRETPAYKPRVSLRHNVAHGIGFYNYTSNKKMAGLSVEWQSSS